ncbi:MAG: HdeD family acid-resistance protein [Mycobacterium sp.]
MSTTTGTNLFPHLWKNVLLTGILSVILGVMMLAWPGPTLVVAAIFFGAYLLVTGISQIFHAFTLHISGGGRALLFISGAASLVLAVIAIRHIGDAIWLLAIWIGIGFVFRGVATAAAAISDHDTPARGWEIFIGIVTVIAGIILLAYPFSSLATLLYVAGFWLIFVGIMEIIASFSIKKAGNEVRGVISDAIRASR